ncbi:hypothetical protein QA612_09845 [Evansella sp. AB-P1]|uniref:hypothetical protein n=1 Tax=Evansella sp. AB-P1 TaxID=3037653 RepID=UPI00241FA793|nr:hypothetical protein [Evansella sp. AB-P1]MDG5787801.1 hypothetical protein [Evansella sp. AB-P1]
MDKKNGHLTTFEVTIPTSIVIKMDYMVKELDKEGEEPGVINRNGFIAYLISNFYVNEGYYDKDNGLVEGELAITSHDFPLKECRDCGNTEELTSYYPEGLEPYFLCRDCEDDLYR